MINRVTITGFALSEKHEGYKVIFTKTKVKDPIFELDKEVRRTYVCLKSYLFTDFIGKEVDIELTKSPKTGELVVTAIKEVL